MSAPILTCALLDAAGVILKEAQRSMGRGVRVHMSYFPPDELGEGEFFNVTIHDDTLVTGKCFGGNGDTARRALMNANSDRQAFAEKQATLSQPPAREASDASGPASSIPAPGDVEAVAAGQGEQRI